jgi:hypothetical protein
MNVVEVSQIEDIEGECKPTSNDKQTNLLGGLVQGSCMRSSYRNEHENAKYINENKPSDLTRSFRILGNLSSMPRRAVYVRENPPPRGGLAPFLGPLGPQAPTPLPKNLSRSVDFLSDRTLFLHLYPPEMIAVSA